MTAQDSEQPTPWLVYAHSDDAVGANVAANAPVTGATDHDNVALATTNRKLMRELQHAHAQLSLRAERRERDRAYTAQRAAEQRADFRNRVLFGAVLVAVSCAILSFAVWAETADRKLEEREQQRQADIARACITAGRLWVNGNCITTTFN